MSILAKATTAALSPASEREVLKRAPTLYAIIFFKIVKGILFFAFGVALYFQATHNLPEEWAGLLRQPIVVHIFEKLRIHPENKFFQHIAEQIDNVRPKQVRVWGL